MKGNKIHYSRIASILEKIKAVDLKDFLQRLLEDILPESLEGVHDDTICVAAKFLYSQYKNKFKKKDYLIDFYFDEDYAVMNVLNKDMPFLLDSINNELRSSDVEIKLLLQNTFLQGNDRIAVMQFYISNWHEKEFYLELKKKLIDVLECVALSVKDWEAMTGFLHASIDDSKSLSKPKLSNEEIVFLEFLNDGNFIFLGYACANLKSGKISDIDESKARGVVRNTYYLDRVKELKGSNVKDIDIKKSHLLSNVHRKSYMLGVFVKSSSGDFLHMFFGFLITKVYYMSVFSIPLIREKAEYVMVCYKHPRNSYNSKELATALEEFPRSELLQITKKDLFKVAVGIVSLSINPRIKTFIREDKNQGYISCLVFIPKIKFSTRVRNDIEKILCDHFCGFVTKHYVKIGEGELTRLQLMVKLLKNDTPSYNTDNIEKLITNVINVWDDNLRNALNKKFSKKDADILFRKYVNVFSVKYSESFTANQALHDIDAIEELLADNEVVFKVYRSSECPKNLVQLKIFSVDKELHLSSVFSVIDNIGLFILDVATFVVKLKHSGETKKVYIHYFRSKTKSEDVCFQNSIREKIELCLKKIWLCEIDNDAFNSLIFYLGIDHREVNLLRIYAKYLKQVKFEFSFDYILSTLIKYREISILLIELFRIKFEPYKNNSLPSQKIKIKKIKKSLDGITVFVEDKILSTYLNLISSTKRTNFYVKDEKGDFRSFISVKLASNEIDCVPLPKPEVDTFVYSAHFEAIHLRGSKVARGGIRWTDRTEDFRKVVLDLMKAQITKNALIVPSGCKGGFVVKDSFKDKDSLMKVGISSYESFLQGILDITDNVIDKKIVHPKNVVCHDGDDSYFVVAADKGTATFSDFANVLSKKNKFWLGDAFASGGSYGYDHKKIGITAKGAWVSVQNHFHSINIDPDNDEFTVVGIGDMSGDVFGNGMLLSKKIKLVAAFNHMHIFIDPNPDPLQSFKERLRLFELKGSKWSDYKHEVLSKGGGIYDRSSKEISLSKEASEVLGLSSNGVISPDMLIRSILKSPVDLLWSAGIGTYIKGEFEEDVDIGDKSNDNLRILGKEMRCKVVGEGGNLGFTQKGRVEFAKTGGLINTDFIDNSGGVDCSDHEVNIKIAFEQEINLRNITFAERNKILTELEDGVAKAVLQNNYRQALLIDIETFLGAKNLQNHEWFVDYLESKGELQRELESLPTQDEFQKMKLEKESLSRPEVSILVAYGKNFIAKILKSHNFTEDHFYKKILISYFPEYMQNHFQKAITSHILGNAIIATVVSNEFVDVLGCTFFHELLEERGHNAVCIVNAFYIVINILNVNDVLKKIQKFSNKISPKTKYELFFKIQKTVKRGVKWLLMHYKDVPDVKLGLSLYSNSFEKLKSEFKKAEYPFKNILKQQVLKIEAILKDSKYLKDIVEEMSYYSLIGLFFDIVSISDATKVNLDKVVKVFFRIRDRLYIAKISEMVSKGVLRDRNDVILNDYIDNDLRKITVELVFAQIKNEADIKKEDFIPTFIKDKFMLEKFDKYVEELLGEINTENYMVLVQIFLNRLKELLHSGNMHECYKEKIIQ